MALTYSTSSLNVRITESITLAGVDRGSSTVFNVNAVKYIENGLITLGTALKAIVVVGDSATAKNIPAAGIKYIRLSNLDTSYVADIRVTGDGTEEVWFQIPAYQSFMLSDTSIFCNDDAFSSSPTFADITSIYAKSSSAMSLEYYIAST